MMLKPTDPSESRRISVRALVEVPRSLPSLMSGPGATYMGLSFGGGLPQNGWFIRENPIKVDD